MEAEPDRVLAMITMNVPSSDPPLGIQAYEQARELAGPDVKVRRIDNRVLTSGPCGRVLRFAERLHNLLTGATEHGASITIQLASPNEPITLEAWEHLLTRRGTARGGFPVDGGWPR